MPYQSAFDNLLRRPELIVLVTDAPAGAGVASTTLASAAAAGDTTIAVASGTDINAGPIRIGSGELLECTFVESVASNVATLTRPLRLSHNDGAPVVEQLAYNIGDVDGDVSMSISQESQDQASAMRLLPFTILRGNLSIGFQFRLLGTTLENVCVALGMAYAKVTGANTAIDPKLFQTDFRDVDTLRNASLIVVSSKQDGTRVVHELWSLAFDYTGVSVQFARAQNGAVPVSVMGLSALLQFDLAANAALPFTALTTYRGTQGKVFRELLEVGVFEPVGSATTLSDEGGGGAAGEKALTLAGTVSGLAGGDFVAIGAEDLVEVHQSNTVAGTALALRTGLLREVLNGAAVQKVTKVPFATMTQGGVTLNIGGSTQPIYSEFRDLPIGMQQDTVQCTASFSTMDLLVANIARALGVPASQVSGNGALLSKLVASRRILAVYAEGITQDGTFCRMVLWGTTQEVQSLQLALGSGSPTSVPFTVRPASGLQLTQWAA
jgi:hypothetical protein